MNTTENWDEEIQVSKNMRYTVFWSHSNKIMFYVP